MGQQFLAKSSGIALEDHTRHVMEQLEYYLLPAHQFALDKYERLTGKNLAARSRQAVLWHDEGKKHPAWQEPCRKDYEEWKQWNNNGRRGKEPNGKNLQRSGVRHEMASLVYFLKTIPDARLPVQVAIAAHHSKLGRRHSERWKTDCNGEFSQLWLHLAQYGNQFEPHQIREALLHRYEFDAPRALLQMSDHRASAYEQGKEIVGFTPFRYSFPYDKKRGVQQEIEKLWNLPLALLRAPTGSGKTDAAFLWAQHQIIQKRADRVVIAMPTRFTANALAIGNASKLSQTGLQHSSARIQADDLDTQVEIGEMARLLETPVTVTTIDHLCITLTGAREDHHCTFFNLAHSCVIIDEADFYDTFTQLNLVVLLDALKILEVPVLLMSATLPESACKLYAASKIYEDKTDSNRIRCKLIYQKDLVTHPEQLRGLLQPSLDGKPMIVYANTVRRAQRYYRWFKRQKVKDENIILYHSRYTEDDKKQIEERLSNMLGPEAWKTGTAHGVAILTQIGELSVNISADYMVSELAPLDRLVQRIGRLSRFPESKGPGTIYVIRPGREKEGNITPYPAPYGSFQSRTGWTPAIALTATDEKLMDGEYTAEQFVDLVNQLYVDGHEPKPRERGNQDRYKSLIVDNWLLLPGDKVPEDAEEAQEWHCRDIDPQSHILVKGEYDNGFGETEPLENWTKWRKLLLTNAVTSLKYEVENALKNSWVEKRTFYIGRDSNRASTVEAYVLVSERHYTSTEGLRFPDPEDEEIEDDE